MLTGYCPVLCSLCGHRCLCPCRAGVCSKSGRSSTVSVPDLKDSLFFNTPGRMLYLCPHVCAVGYEASSQISSGNISFLPIESFCYISRGFEHQSYVGLYNCKNKTLGEKGLSQQELFTFHCKVIKAGLNGRFIRVHGGGKNTSAKVIIKHKEMVSNTSKVDYKTKCTLVFNNF